MPPIAGVVLWEQETIDRAAARHLVLPYGSGLPDGALSPEPRARPVGQTVIVDSSAGATIVDNNVAVSIPPGLAGGAAGPLTVTVQPVAAAGAARVGTFAARTQEPASTGWARISSEASAFRVSVMDGNGRRLAASAVPVELTIRCGAADMAAAGGHVGMLAPTYLVEPGLPDFANPNHLPPGSWLFFAPSVTRADPSTRTVTVQTQVLGGVTALFTNPAPYAWTVNDGAPLLSSFDPPTSQVFGTRPRSSYLQVLEPPIGDRLLVQDLKTGGSAYVNTADVAPVLPLPS